MSVRTDPGTEPARTRPTGGVVSVPQPAPRRSVVMFGSYDERLHPRVAVLREGLTAAGCHVAEVNEPLGASTADKVAATGSLRAATLLVSRVVRSWWRLARRGRRVDSPELVVVGYLGQLDVHLARLLWPRSVIVLDQMVALADTVRNRALGRPLTVRLLEQVDRAARSCADVVLVDTEEQRHQLPPATRSKAVVVPVGASGAWYGHRPPPPPPPLRVCFVGLFTPLHGAPVIGRALSTLLERVPDVVVSMVGTGQDRDRTSRAAGPAAERIDWIDWIDIGDLPEFVASHHVSLGIFGTTPNALRVVPTKVYQSLVAGSTVVTSDTEPQRRAFGEDVIYVPPGDADALAEVLIDLATARRPLVVASTERRASFAPERVVEPLLHARPHRVRGRRGG